MDAVGNKLQARTVAATTKRVYVKPYQHTATLSTHCNTINTLQHYQHTATLSTHCNTRALLSRSMTVSTENATPPKSTESRTQIFQYLAVQIRMVILVKFEFVPKNLSFSIWWISEEVHFQWNLSQSSVESLYSFTHS